MNKNAHRHSHTHRFMAKFKQILAARNEYFKATPTNKYNNLALFYIFKYLNVVFKLKRKKIKNTDATFLMKKKSNCEWYPFFIYIDIYV